MRRGLASAAALAALALVLAGCTETPAVSRGNLAPTGTDSTSASPAPTDTADLAAQKKAAGIEDCPTSEADAAVVKGGLPDVSVRCLGGGRDVRLAGLRGRPMVVNVWAQWCGPCRQEAPFLADVASTNRSSLTFLGLDYDDRYPARAIEFARFASWSYPQLYDPDQALAAGLQVAAMPTTFFVRADGTIAYRHAGPFASADELRQAAQEHLGVSP